MKQAFVAAMLGLAALGAVDCLGAGYVEEWARMKPLVPRGYVCFRTTNSLTVDGRLSEPSWQSTSWTQDFVDLAGDTNRPPRFRTRVKMLWDESALYVAAELEQPQVWGVLTSSASNLADDDCFAVCIDTDGDGHDYWQFEVNARGTARVQKLDKPFKDGGQARAVPGIQGLRSGVRVNGTLNAPSNRDTGWTLEIAFPWEMLIGLGGRRLVLYDGDQWRVNFCRVEWPTDVTGKKSRRSPTVQPEHSVWSPIGAADLHRPERWGYLQFTRKRSGRARFNPDSALPARDALQEVYYHQKDFQVKHSRWASSLAELGLEFRPTKEVQTAPLIQLTDDGFEASVAGPVLGLKPLHWYIRQDGRFWYDPELRPQVNRYYRSLTIDTDEP